jgi:hypothetical protein
LELNEHEVAWLHPGLRESTEGIELSAPTGHFLITLVECLTWGEAELGAVRRCDLP